MNEPDEGGIDYSQPFQMAAAADPRNVMQLDPTDPNRTIDALRGRHHGASTECVAPVQAFTGVGHTSTWAPLGGVGPDTVPGSPIATFDRNGRYTNTRGQSHAAIYLGSTPDGSMIVGEQANGMPFRTSVIPFTGQGGERDAKSYSVIGDKRVAQAAPADMSADDILKAYDAPPVAKKGEKVAKAKGDMSADDIIKMFSTPDGAQHENHPTQSQPNSESASGLGMIGRGLAAVDAVGAPVRGKYVEAGTDNTDIQPRPDSVPEAMFNAGVRGAKDAWQNTPDILSSQASQWLSSHGLGVVGDNTGLPSYLLKGAAAGGNALVSAARTGITRAADAIGDHPSVPFGLGNIPLLGRDVAAMVENPLAAAPRGSLIPLNGNPTPTQVREASLNARIEQLTGGNPLMSRAITSDAATGSMVPIPGKGSPLAPSSTALATTTPPLPPAQVSASVAPRTAAAAKKIASSYYKMADDAGGTLTPEFTNKFLDEVKGTAPQTLEGQTIAGENPVTQLVDRVQSLRDKPISLAGAQEIDEALGNLIDKEFGPKGLSKDGKALHDLQTTFRDMIQNAGPEETTGGTTGFDALSAGRKAWAQAMKMSDLERIAARAEMTDNPATGIKSGIRVLLSNPTRARGYSPAEIAALQQASSRGTLGSALHVFGSRLVPLAAGATAFGASGFIPAMAVAGATHLGSSLMRNAATALQSRRMDNALSVLGSSVPPAP